MIQIKDPFEKTVFLALDFLERINTPRSYAIWSLCKEHLLNAYEPIVFKESVDALGLPVKWCDINRFMVDYQATVLLSKLPPKHATSELSERAIAGFKESEARNAAINQQWLPSKSEFGPIIREDDRDRLALVRQHLVTILGRAPSLQTLMNEGEWTTGASVGISHATACLYTKAKEGVTITYPLARALLDEQVVYNDAINASSLILVPGNKVTTVPKDIATDRTIAMEPDINCFMQRSIGLRMNRRLKRFGIDLNDQSLNQKACMLAYARKSATIDLKNASNSVLLMPVMQTFPSDWARLIELTRSPHGSFDMRADIRSRDAEWFEYSMLSSMGNGFTFELESTLFFSICLACGCEMSETYVYGDDIIVPQRCVDDVCRMLGYFGLEVNWRKSFTSGAFFESCGVYSYYGVDISPFKIKDLLYATKDSVVLLNKLRMFAHLYNRFDGCAKWVLPTWQMCLRWLPLKVRTKLKGPFGSLCIWSNVSEAKPIFSKKKQGLLYGLLAPTLFWHFADDVYVLKARLLEVKGPYVPGQTITGKAMGQRVKDIVCGYNIITASCSSSWYDWGQWQ